MIICDDAGLFVPNPKVSAIDRDGIIMLVGSLLICAANQNRSIDNDFQDLTDEEVQCILNSVMTIKTRNHSNGLKMIYGMEG